MKVLLYGGMPVAGILFYISGSRILPFFCFALTGIWYAISFSSKKGFFGDLRAPLSLSWWGGIAVTTLQLSRFQKDFVPETWCVLFGFYACFLLGFTWRKQRAEKKPLFTGGAALTEREEKRAFFGILTLFVLSVLTFVAEALILGYIPIFSKETHAYNYFHVTGLHYFTVSICLVPPVSAVFLRFTEKLPKTKERVRRRRVLLIVSALAFVPPLMMLSKLFLAIGVILSLLIFLADRTAEEWKKLLKKSIPLLILFAVGIVIAVYKRNYPPGYIDRIFQMKNPEIPMPLQYIYIYICNNFENLNYLIQVRPPYSFGARTFFPLFALTGLKFLFPAVTAFHGVVVVKELTTLTLVYDAVLDGGLPGAVLFGLILGALMHVVTELRERSSNPYGLLIYTECFFYLSLSFFSTWFSNPTVWFWMILSIVFFFLVSPGRRSLVKKKEV